MKKIIEDFYKVKIGNDIFYATFELTMCESEIDREIWDSTPYNSSILKNLRFKHSLLHCVRLIDDGQIWNLKREQRKYFIDWVAKDKNDRVSPEEISHALMENLKPYGYVKKYKLGKDEKLVLTKMY